MCHAFRRRDDPFACHARGYEAFVVRESLDGSLRGGRRGYDVGASYGLDAARVATILPARGSAYSLRTNRLETSSRAIFHNTRGGATVLRPRSLGRVAARERDDVRPTYGTGRETDGLAVPQGLGGNPVPPSQRLEIERVSARTRGSSKVTSLFGPGILARLEFMEDSRNNRKQ